MTITEPGLVHGMPDETYHADPVPSGSLSSTFARLLTEHVPAKANIRRSTFKPSKAMNLGSAAHAHALGTGPELIVWEFDGPTVRIQRPDASARLPAPGPDGLRRVRAARRQTRCCAETERHLARDEGAGCRARG